MKIAIFGASGRTGQMLVRDALEQGDQVTALARTPTKIEMEDEHLRVVAGDVQDARAVEQAIAGADAVISAMSPANNQAEFSISRGMENILAAMHKHGVRRLVVTSGAGVIDPEDRLVLFNRAMNLLLKLMARNVYEDMWKAAEIIRASDLDWTLVRAPMLVDGEPTGAIKVGMVGRGMGPRLTRGDLAAYALRVTKSGEQVHRAPAISS